ncbi:MAG TPA: hypothetical protein VLL48_11370 [Longimicrobiales bacterium]|nr:hypothetical protein [Longimicrobiales bacterium]
MAVVGWLSLHALVTRGGFRIRSEEEGGRGLLRAALLATLLAGAVALFDLQVVFPRGINVPFPRSLLFYPAIALVAEVAFHALPLALLLLGVVLVGGARRWEGVVLYALAVVALLEPLFQLGFPSAAALPAWGRIYLGVHLLVFNGLQLWIFRRHDFLSMYAFRLVYYGWWHVAWGHARLELLF